MAEATIHARFIRSIWINDPGRPGYARKTFVLKPEVLFWFEENGIQPPYDVQYSPLVDSDPSIRYAVKLVFLNEDDAIMFKLKWNEDVRIYGD